jgi:hypothetical protein
MTPVSVPIKSRLLEVSKRNFGFSKFADFRTEAKHPALQDLK